MNGTVRCSDCGAENASSQRFCGSCGEALERSCSSCGHTNPAGFRFCGTCGSPLDAETTAPTPQEERRWATVLFADLSGYTALAEGMDPEDVRTVSDRCVNRLGEIVESYGGTVVSVAGDGVMAAFGAPVAHEDDPERAVRAALEMQRCAAEEAADFGGLPLRVGVNTGEIMFAPVGPEGRREYTLSGDTTNTASRLETAAPQGGVLVGEETFLAIHRTIRCEEVEPLRLKGKQEPVRAWFALEPLADPGARPMSELPLVGRGRELDLLGAIWEAVVHDRRPHLITLLGDPGIGKSRLAAEFLSRVDEEGARTVRARSLPYGERAGYGAFAEVVKEVAGIFESDGADPVRAKLEAAMRDLLGPDGDELAAQLAILVGLAEESADVEKRTLYAAARRFVEALARRTPVAILLEDIQWADQSLLELVEWLAARVEDVPVLFLTVARPELLESHPGWGTTPASYTTLSIDRLHGTDSRRLAERLLGPLASQEDAVAEIERRSGGNPLFIEELAAWLGQTDRPDRPLPTSVQAIIAARLDALHPRMRDVLLDASVVGETFWEGALAEPDTAPEALDALETRDFIRRVRTSRIEGDEEFVFKHVLIRDVAYGTLPRATRRERHGRVAAFLEGTSIGAGSSAMVAHHWRNAGEKERAVPHLLDAAERASRGWAKAEAVDLYAQALELIDPDDPGYKDVVRRRAVARTMLMHAYLDASTLAGRGEDPREGNRRG